MPTVLIIEDNDELRETLVLVLEDQGYDTLTARDGQTGILAFRHARPDLVLTDVIMPGSDGIEAIREIRAIEPDARIVAMSGGAMIGHDYHLRMAKQLGASGVLAKPFEIDDLVRVIAGCLPPGLPRVAGAG